MGNIQLEIWGRLFDLDVIYDCYEDEEILDSQKMAFNKFIENNTKLLQTAYSEIEKYCRKNHSDELEDDFENIFKYVKPESLFIKRRPDDRIIALMCKFKFDLEHGLAVVIKNEEAFEVGLQDIIL